MAVTTTSQSFGSKYELVQRIARGGMAEIFLAQAKGPAGFEKKVVIKRVLPHLSGEPSFIKMFLQEARLGARLSHPNIVQIFDFGQVDGTYFISMEYVEGRSLLDVVVQTRRAGTTIPIGLAVKIISETAEGLHHAHTATDSASEPLGIVHRDVSPSNILVSFAGVAKISDFGIAKATSALHQTRSGTIKGKYAYMSPQQCLSQPLDNRSDIFSLGIVLFEVTTYTRLFARSNEALTIHALLTEPIPRPSALVPDYPPILEQIVMHCLERDPERRYQDGLSLHRDLEKYLRDSDQGCSAVDIAEFMQALYPDSIRAQPPQPLSTDGSYNDLMSPYMSGYSLQAVAGRSHRDLILLLALILAGSAAIWGAVLWSLYG
jgi:eukaryotic-like serine/threonine-protein kinase